MEPEEFRQAGRRLVDWIAEYRASLAEGGLAVRSSVEPGALKALLPSSPPASAESFDAILSDLEHIVVPGLTHVQHPSNFAWFPANASLSSVLGDFASTGIGALGISWQSAPALTEIEEVVLDWLRQLCGLSESWHGTVQDTASTACLVALLVARERASGFSERRGGLQSLAAPLVAYASEQAHSSVPKAVLLAGFGADNLRLVETDPTSYAMSATALEQAIALDVAAGRVPAAVVATVGTTTTAAVDPLEEICALAAEHGLYVHVDAAMAGTAMLLAECRYLFSGIEHADSITFNPHKWMGTALDFSAFYVRDPDLLTSVLSTSPSYLRSASDGDVTQYRDWGIPLGRRFRALKLWFQLRLDGAEEIRSRLRRDLANARWLADQVSSDASWRVLAPVNLQTVCLRHEPEGLTDDDLDAHTLSWAEKINASGRAHLTTAQLRGRWIVRVSIGAAPTQRSHVEALWQLMREAATLSLSETRSSCRNGSSDGTAPR